MMSTLSQSASRADKSGFSHWLSTKWHSYDGAISQQAATQDLVVRPISEFYSRKPERPGLLIGHTAITRAALLPSVRLLASIIARAL